MQNTQTWVCLRLVKGLQSATESEGLPVIQDRELLSLFAPVLGDTRIIVLIMQVCVFRLKSLKQITDINVSQNTFGNIIISYLSIYLCIYI